jgi:hypothetical protein
MAIQNLKAYDEFIDFITSTPTLEQIADYYMSPESRERISELLFSNQNRRLNDAEMGELDDYEELGRIIRQIKISAHVKLAEQRRQEMTQISAT